MRVVSRRSLLAGAVGLTGTALAGSALTACTPGDVPTPTAPTPTPRGGPPVVDEPALPQIAVRELWHAPQRTGLGYLDEAVLSGDLLVVDAREKGVAVPGLRVLGTADGKLRWNQRAADANVRRALSGTPSTSTIVVGGPSAQPLMFQTVYLDPGRATTESYGVVGLSVTDGSMRWSTVVVAAQAAVEKSQREMAATSARVVDADAETVLVATGFWMVVAGSARLSRTRRARTVLLSAETGKQLWKVEDLLPIALAGDVVVAMRSGGGVLGRGRFGELVGLDRRTGKQLWTSRDSFGQVFLHAASARLLAVFGQESASQLMSVLLLDPATGEAVSDPLPGAPSAVCLGTTQDDRPLAVWLDARDPAQLLSFALPDREVRRSAHSLATSTSLFRAPVRRGYVWCSSSDDGMVRAVDRSGNVCSDPVPGAAARAVDDHHLVVLRLAGTGGSTDDGFGVYAMV